MKLDCSFRFIDEELNRHLIEQFKKSRVQHRVDKAGHIHYSSEEEEFVDNELISAVRDQVYLSWQVLTCPRDWATRYRRYMWRHEIPFTEERIDGEVAFLLPRSFRPHTWKLEGRSLRKEPLAR